MFFNKGLTDAAKAADKSSTYRMMLVAQSMIQGTYTVPKRLGKPFNPLLGETYEIVTTKFRYFSESVSHHPPIFCLNCQGSGYELRRTIESVQQFTGKQVRVFDKNWGEIYLNVGDKKELYKFKEANMVVGNIMIGERYCEPQG